MEPGWRPSTAALSGVLGRYVGEYHEADFATLTQLLPDPSLIGEPDFPWRYVPLGELRVITMCYEHVLCLNPGSRTELILSGEAMAELIAAVAGAFSEDAEVGPAR